MIAVALSQDPERVLDWRETRFNRWLPRIGRQLRDTAERQASAVWGLFGYAPQFTESVTAQSLSGVDLKEEERRGLESAERIKGMIDSGSYESEHRLGRRTGKRAAWRSVEDVFQ